VAAHLACGVAERLVAVLERDPVHPVAEGFHHFALQLDLLFFAFSHSLTPFERSARAVKARAESS
jgi:hypothetical protein